MDAAQENGYLVFETTHFSEYAIAQFASASGGGPNGGTSSGTADNPKTGSSSGPVIPLALLGAGSAAGFTVTAKRAKYRIRKRG